MNKLYSVHDHWTDINKKNDVDIESIDGVITGIKVNGEDYGGGEWQNIFDNTITTVSAPDGFYTTNIGVVIEADSIRVTFDGVEYNCPKRRFSEISTNYYGALTPLESGEEDFDWSEFPFSIATVPDGVSMSVTTQTAGTHTLKIDIPQSGGESDFTKVNVLSVTEDGSRTITLDVLSQNAKNNNYFYLTIAQLSTLGLADVTENTPFILGGINYDAEHGYDGTAYYCKPDGSVSTLYGMGNENENFIVFKAK